MTKSKKKTVTAPDKAKPRKSVQKSQKQCFSETIIAGVCTKTPEENEFLMFNNVGEVIRELKKLPKQLPVYIVRDEKLSPVRFIGIGNAREDDRDSDTCGAVVIF